MNRTKLLAAALAATLIPVSPVHAAENTVVAGYTVSVDASAQTCTITPTDVARAQTKNLGDTMWVGAEKAILSTGQPWAAAQAQKINEQRQLGTAKGNVAITTPMAALEALSVLKAGKDTKGAVDTLKKLPIIGSLIGLIPLEGTVSSIFDTIGSLIGVAIDVDKLMLPGELAARFVNPSIDASTPFVASGGQTFALNKIAAEKNYYQKEIDNPSYARAPLTGAALKQARALDPEFKKAWAAYNTDAVKALDACIKPVADTAPTNPQDVRPQDVPNSPDLLKPLDPQQSGSDASSRIDAADKLSSLAGNENGSSKAIGITSAVIGIPVLLGIIAALIPVIKPLLPPEISRLLP
ncbi:hypothetical protein N7326_06355 [Corynebacterium sp. ES2794-CONJ1]|uniref:hypothetical protein n=1 Tax=unclassified Corynebacterium TaxID=2624378 RepID=UPI002169D1FB|nr:MULTISPECIES: hypothetical protein [unclassified Corynebacterium]MCS4491987.1 hypothetical protein [Corynebacterium sp. ES2715-CONJ3]MCU9519493.1 hypothetical protein [Corynebacterium sp. ES2794-CONJ1]